MIGIRRYVSILIILFNPCPFMAQGQTPERVETQYINKASPLKPELVQLQTEWVNKFSKIDQLMDVLGIKPGMTVLDIGSGSGQYAYKFAQRLKRKGTVFATDISIDRINYIEQEARARNLTNLSPVLVKSEGLDEFYTKNKFDLIFVAHTYYYLRPRISYFKWLKDSLAKDGQLIILHEKLLPRFSLGDISDLDGLIKQLSSEKFDSPFYSHLQKSTQELLRQPLDDKTKELLRNFIIDDLNSMSKDPHFLSHFLKDGITFKEEIDFTKDERAFVNLYFKYLKCIDKVLDNKGVFDINNRNITHKYDYIMGIINTVLIVQKFRKYLYNGEPAPYLARGYGHLQNDNMIQELSLAGYRLIHKYDFIPFHIILVFTPDKSTG